MYQMTITYDGPDTSAGATAKAIKAGIDKALENHRKEFLPEHFVAQARQRYGAAYHTAARRKRAMAFRELLSRMSPQQQQEFFKARAAHGRSGWYYHEQVWLFQQGITHTAPRRRTGTGTSGAGQSADPQGKLPLVDTGRMREITLRTGPATFVGPVSGRRMTIKNLPWYLRISPQGAIQKEKALQAVVQPEVTKFARVVDKELQTFLSS